jgi:hypothetical protein
VNFEKMLISGVAKILQNFQNTYFFILKSVSWLRVAPKINFLYSLHARRSLGEFGKICESKEPKKFLIYKIAKFQTIL